MDLHQESASKYYLFTRVMDELTNKIQDEVSFTKDIVLIDEFNKGINQELELMSTWMHELKQHFRPVFWMLRGNMKDELLR